MFRLVAVSALVFACTVGLGAQSLSPPAPDDGWSGVITDLQSVSDDLAANQKQIEELRAKIAQLQTLGKDSAAEIARLQTLVDEHAARVKELGQKYAQVLGLAQKLKRDAEQASMLNYVFGGVAVAAVIVAVGEGVVLANR
jgi:septal ring factor EnvC (AmiA/AmiB activator)